MRKEGNRNIPEWFRLSFSSPYLSFPIYRFQKINLIRVRTPRARRISFTFHRCGLSTTSRRPSSLPPSLWRASHTGGRRVEFVSRRLFPVDLLALANLSKGERRGEGIRVVRGIRARRIEILRFTIPLDTTNFDPLNFSTHW